MGTRSDSGVRLQRLMAILENTILSRMVRYCVPLNYQHIAFPQDPCTSLLTIATHSPHHAWIRDNVYAVHAMWAMHLAFRKRADKDEDVRTANELALMAVKCMQVRWFVKW